MTLLPPKESLKTHPQPDELRKFSTRLQQADELPFTGNDSSAGMEYELQVAVEGKADTVDLPLSIRDSSYYRNLEKRVLRGDLSSRPVLALTDYLDNNRKNIWENSWVRLDTARMSGETRELLHTDFLADKSQPSGPNRSDLARFHYGNNTAEKLRIPISYLLKLSLTDIITTTPDVPQRLRDLGTNLLNHFISDNTSPEIISLSVQFGGRASIGTLAARESCRTFLVTQLLIQYANKQFGLSESGQRCIIYNAPLAPLRQKQLNEIVPDNFYRQLFMSPCLSGWDRGEEKQEYMALCHKTLSRSQLNTIHKLKDAGIITNNLVILPNTSNTCLSNNGTHVSLGSDVLTRMAAETGGPFSPGTEKYFGDLVIKIVEHFLPLFVSTYSAAPKKVDFADFHPESMLGFLPHEIDFTHLRMLWRRWKKKADIRFMGHALTPFGPRRFDDTLARLLRLKGDLIHDFRLIDYLVTLLSTETSPGLDGRLGNHGQLTRELAEAGIFDSRMSIYLPYRMRAFRKMGYAGFEGRFYSLFPSLLTDMQEAVDLQNIVTALAYYWAISGKIPHEAIPDTPFIESERRQIFFASAIGLPTVFIRRDTENILLREVLERISAKRNSRRYRNYVRIPVKEYSLALIDLIRQDGPRIAPGNTIDDLTGKLINRIENRKDSAAGALLHSASQTGKGMDNPRTIPAATFASNMEDYYRNSLRKKHLQEGLQVLKEDLTRLETHPPESFRLLSQQLATDGFSTSRTFLEKISTDIVNESADPADIRRLMHICLAVIEHQ